MYWIRAYGLPSGFFLFYFAAAGSLQPWLALFLQSRGMNPHQIGWLASIATITAIIASPLWSALADALKIHRLVLRLASSMALIPILILLVANAFWSLALGMLLYALFLSPIIPLVDNAILSGLPQKEHYGRVRLWGSVGWGLAALGSGILIETYGTSALFTLFISLMVLNFVIILRLPVTSPKPSETSYFSDLKHLLQNPAWVGFLLTALFIGICLAITHNYLVLFLKDLGASETLYGFSVTVGALSELPIFMLAPLLLAKFNPRGLILIALVTLVVRMMWFSLLDDPRWVLGGQLLHGLSFAGMWSAAVVYARRIAPIQLGASAQALLGLTIFGLGGVIGALLGAELYAAVGPALMFRYTAGIALLGIVLFWVTGYLAETPLTEAETATPLI